MAKNIIMPGDQFAEKGTTAWADWQRSRLRTALKEVHFEARQIVGVIRDMCSGKVPAWHLMTRLDGTGFRTFEEFVTTPVPEGLGFPDYGKFRGMALSEPGVMNEREYDLLTAAPPGPAGRPSLEKQGTRNPVLGVEKQKTLRAISRAPVVIRKLYISGMIDAKLAELLGPDEGTPGYAERKAKADRALAAIRAVGRNGDDAAYRRAVNEAVRRAFGKPTSARTWEEQIDRLWAKGTKAQREAFISRIGEQGW